MIDSFTAQESAIAHIHNAENEKLPAVILMADASIQQLLKGNTTVKNSVAAIIGLKTAQKAAFKCSKVRSARASDVEFINLILSKFKGATIMSFSYANPTSGPSAGGIGWFVYDTFTTINPGQTITGLTGALNDGTTVTFDLTATNVSGAPRTFDAFPIPVNPLSAFGTAGYTGITGNAALNASFTNLVSNNELTLSNIVVKDSLGNPVPNYTAIVADAEVTGGVENWVWNTNGGPWTQLAVLGTGTSPTLTGLGTTTATLTGGASAISVSYVLTTQNPTQLQLTTGISATSQAQGREAVAIGFATTRVHLQKNVAARIDPADQFVLNITGSPSDTVTTTGAASGIQTEAANVFAIPGSTYTLNESMAPGSVSSLTNYTQVISAGNATPAGSVPPVGNLPITFAPALGDDVTYTILNVAPETFTKTVDKTFADVGDLITYTVVVDNPNNFALSNVLVTDPTPAGTTYAGNLSVSAPFTGTDPAAGITITTIAADSSVTLSWQVQVNSIPPVPNPIPNVATIDVPGGTSGNTNAVTTQVNTAYVTVMKMVDKLNASTGDVLTYTLQLTNSGNVPANNVVITDAIPAGTTFVPGSLTGATGTPPTLNLAGPIAAGGGIATVTFQVLVGDSLPTSNPVPNTASTAYNYTVDPANPNAARGTALSNTVNTQINIADVTTIKTVDLAFADTGDILTYTLVLRNSGNVPADNVVITDAVPIGTTFVTGSVTGATGTPPNLTLANPILPGDSATVTFKVQVGGTIPLPNPIPNNANAVFTFTVDPANPDGANGTSASNVVTTQINNATIDTTKTVDKAFVDTGDVITYTLLLHNIGNVPANNVVITDPVPAGTTFIAGSVIGASGSLPLLTLTNPIAPGGFATVSFQVQAGNTIPTPNPVLNSASVAYTYTVNPAVPNGANAVDTSNIVSTQVNNATIITTKAAEPAFTEVGGIITYTITLQNTGNVVANHVILNDVLSAGATFVPGSLTGATGTLPNLVLNGPVPAGGIATITFQVKVGSSVPNPNPVSNTANAAFVYTVDPAVPNGAPGTSNGNTVSTLVNNAHLTLIKSVNKTISYLGDTLTYQLAVTNSGNVPADNALITDVLSNGTYYVPGTLLVSVPATGTPTAGIQLTNPISPGQTVNITFQAIITAMPLPNPIVNKAAINYTYMVDPADPDGVAASVSSNEVYTLVFRHNFSQPINDLIESVAMEEAALAAIANAEGAKIQKIVAMGGTTAQELLCLNQSVTDMLDSIALLEIVLKQKIKVVDCQINESLVPFSCT